MTEREATVADRIMLHDRVAIITGGAGGIGGATARLMRSRGAKVFIADRDIEGARKLAAELGGDAFAVAYELELAEEASVVAMVEQAVGRFGRLDILVNNAALGKEGAGDVDIETMDTALWDLVMSVNLRGHMISSREAIPHLVASGSGAIVNIVSNLAFMGHVTKTAYAASKGALLQLTRSIAATHGRKNVRANAVAPGFTVSQNALKGVPPAFVESALSETLTPRLGTPEDLAEAVAFLASDSASNITGQMLVCDGGLTSHIAGMSGALLEQQKR
jgi:NAD(P)-dependent dehydrogenase (short-subunit alcohol dehydrogenase family)